MTARQLAVDMVRPYAERGDDMYAYKRSMHGIGGPGYSASVGGWIGERHYSGDYIVVREVEGQKVNAVYTLKEIWEEALAGQTVLL